MAMKPLYAGLITAAAILKELPFVVNAPTETHFMIFMMVRAGRNARRCKPAVNLESNFTVSEATIVCSAPSASMLLVRGPSAFRSAQLLDNRSLQETLGCNEGTFALRCTSAVSQFHLTH